MQTDSPNVPAGSISSCQSDSFRQIPAWRQQQRVPGHITKYCQSCLDGFGNLPSWELFQLLTSERKIQQKYPIFRRNNHRKDSDWTIDGEGWRRNSKKYPLPKKFCPFLSQWIGREAFDSRKHYFRVQTRRARQNKIFLIVLTIRKIQKKENELTRKERTNLSSSSSCLTKPKKVAPWSSPTKTRKPSPRSSPSDWPPSWFFAWPLLPSWPDMPPVLPPPPRLLESSPDGTSTNLAGDGFQASTPSVDRTSANVPLMGGKPEPMTTIAIPVAHAIGSSALWVINAKNKCVYSLSLQGIRLVGWKANAQALANFPKRNSRYNWLVNSRQILPILNDIVFICTTTCLFNIANVWCRSLPLLLTFIVDGMIGFSPLLRMWSIPRRGRSIYNEHGILPSSRFVR